MSYAYLDKEGILHLHPLEHEAQKHGKYVETNLEYDDSGFPIIGDEGVVYYPNEGTAYIKGNKAKGQSIAVPNVLKQLADKLK
ncbi:hypothetical protein [Paenibacillus polymyxa]|uniref:hypothetical protein n=1 Tax=Paenibacillus polymyxa TaxID=1406 RepID=UPI000FA2C4AE|nr:hypothetical protein [Paenibacillus polymyxa]KAE8560234.1 hypothetical protein BJH92_10160 [Paenibacillus polymyxa]MCJ1218416.1 hypothetical protein [Paenibacillus polymyxa]